MAADWIAETVATLKPFATIEETADFLRVSTRTVRRLIAAGRIPRARLVTNGGARALIPRTEIARYLRSIAPDARRASR